MHHNEIVFYIITEKELGVFVVVAFIIDLLITIHEHGKEVFFCVSLGIWEIKPAFKEKSNGHFRRVKTKNPYQPINARS